MVDQEYTEEDIQATEAIAREVRDARDALVRLLKNRDFQLIITDGYFVTESSRLVLSKSRKELQDDKTQSLLDKQIASIGCLHQYFNTIKVQGNMAEVDLESASEARELLAMEAV